MFLLLALSVSLLSLLPTPSTAACYSPSPAFPVPTWTDSHLVDDFTPVFDFLSKKLDAILTSPLFMASSLSISITSPTETLWTYAHTARILIPSRPGANPVDENSLFRIASITKVFTVLALLQQHDAGTLHLDDPVSLYLSNLPAPLPWKDITLRALASQLSGIPREFAQGDIVNLVPNPSDFGLPPLTADALTDLPQCDEYADYDPPCNATDLFAALSHASPLYAPNQKSTYSNVNYDLLGLVLANVTGQKYESYIQSSIFDALNMSSSTFSPENDTHTVLPAGDIRYWDVDAGVQNPTGGIYSSAADMAKFARHVLTSYNALATGVNWLFPLSWSGGTRAFTGMPWEIFRSSDVLGDSTRPVTFVTKSGGLPGYFSQLVILPEYGLGIVVLVAGKSELLSPVLEAVSPEVVRAAESAIWKAAEKKYERVFVAETKGLNSSITIAADAEGKGLHIRRFISNDTVIVAGDGALPLHSLELFSGMETTATEDVSAHVQLVPTLLFKDEEQQRGEIWRFVVVPERRKEGKKTVFEEFCITDEDQVTYAGLPLNEVVFWHEEGMVELTGWRVKMREVKEEELFVVQP